MRLRRTRRRRQASPNCAMKRSRRSRRSSAPSLNGCQTAACSLRSYGTLRRARRPGRLAPRTFPSLRAAWPRSRFMRRRGAWPRLREGRRRRRRRRRRSSRAPYARCACFRAAPCPRTATVRPRTAPSRTRRRTSSSQRHHSTTPRGPASTQMALRSTQARRSGWPSSSTSPTPTTCSLSGYWSARAPPSTRPGPIRAPLPSWPCGARSCCRVHSSNSRVLCCAGRSSW